MLIACLLPTLASCAHLQRARALDCIPSRLRLTVSVLFQVAVGLEAGSSAGTRHTGKPASGPITLLILTRDCPMQEFPTQVVAYIGFKQCCCVRFEFQQIGEVRIMN